MSWKKRLRTVMACLFLETGVLLGAPMRVEQVEELLRACSQPKIAQTHKQAAERSDE